MISVIKLNTCFYAIYILATVFGIFFPNLTTLFLVLKMIVCVLLYILNCKKIGKLQNFTLFLFILLLALSSIWTSSELKSVILPCHFIIMIVLARYIDVKPIIKQIIIVSCTILFVYYASLSTTVWSSYLNGNEIINPNSLAKYLVVVSIILMTAIRQLKHSLVLRIIFGAISFYFVFLTFCRSAVVAYALYIIVTFIPILENLVFKYRKSIAVMSIIIGTVFPFLYVNMYNSGVLSSDSEYFGKNMYTGRQILWPKLFEKISENPIGLLTGYGTLARLQTMDISNYHSWYFGTLFSFGFLVAIMYFAEFVKNIIKITDKSLVVGCISLMIIGVTEMLALWEITQSLIIILFIYAFLLCKDSKKQDIVRSIS